MSPLAIILLLVLFFLLIGGLPGTNWGYGQHFSTFGGGWGIPGIVLVLLIILIVLLLTGRL